MKDNLGLLSGSTHLKSDSGRQAGSWTGRGHLLNRNGNIAVLVAIIIAAGAAFAVFVAQGA